MSEIKNKNDGTPDPADKSVGEEHGVSTDMSQEESHGGYGGTDRLQSEAGPLQPNAGKDQGKDI